MARTIALSRTRSLRSRLAALLSALGLVAASSGLIMLSAPVAQANGHDHGSAPDDPGGKVGVCHRDRETSTYGFTEVNFNAVEASGHLEHLSPDGSAGDPDLPDYIWGYGGIPADVTVDEFESWCLSLNPTVPPVLGTIGELEVDPIMDCDVYGSITAPASPVNVSYSISPGDFGDGLSGVYVVTATLINDATAFATPLPDGWSLGTTSNTATRTVDVGDYGDCDLVTGTIGQLGITEVGLCNTYGSITAPASRVNVSYSIDPGSFGGGLSGEYVVTATLVAPATAFASIPPDWTSTSDTTAERTVDVGEYVACTGGGDGGGDGTDSATTVVPLEPIWTEATCSTRPGVEYRSVDGVTYRTEGDVAPGSRVTVESAALEGYAFEDGTVSSWAHTFDTPRRCGEDGNGGGGNGGDGGDGGEEPNGGSKPSPTVKGVQKFRPPAGKGDNVQPGTGGPHAVPTAVAAGLTDLSGGHGSPSTFSSPQLAQALVAGGLLLLVVGGGLGLGRRTNGAHEF